MNSDLIDAAETSMAVIRAVKDLPAGLAVNSILLAAFLICDEYGLNKTSKVWDAMGVYEMVKERLEKEED